MAVALGGCAASAAAGEPARDGHTAARELSDFEQRWMMACQPGGRVGTCPPAAFDCGVSFTLTADDGHFRPRLCSPVDDATHAAIHAALNARRAELQRCFRAAEAGAWVAVQLQDMQPRDRSPGTPIDVAGCVAGQVAAALSGLPALPAVPLYVNSGPLDESLPPGTGSLSKQGIRDVINARINEVRACYEAALEVWPRLEGRTKTRFVIAPDGSVALVVTFESSLANPALECCINTAVRGFRFDHPRGGGVVDVTYPFYLELAP
jgi:hypothetical protein